MNDVLDRVYGCLVGGAIGDAMGAPVETWTHHHIRDEYGELDEFLPHDKGGPTEVAGGVTDDTTLRHYKCLSIIEKGGRITPDYWGRTWRELIDTDRLWANEELVRIKLQWGMDPWDAGRGTIPAGVVAMAIELIGIVNAGNPEPAYQDGFTIGGVNQEGINRAAGATVAAGIAEVLTRGATVEHVIETCASTVASSSGGQST